MMVESKGSELPLLMMVRGPTCEPDESERYAELLGSPASACLDHSSRAVWGSWVLVVVLIEEEGRS
jgi:hypothetical protein